MAEWQSLGMVAFDLACERGLSAERLLEARLELIADLAAEWRKASGITPAGKIKRVPPHYWGHAELTDGTKLGEGLDWLERAPLDEQGVILVDFRCSALAGWDPYRMSHEGSHGGYKVLYSDIRISEKTAPAPSEKDRELPPPLRKPTKLYKLVADKMPAILKANPTLSVEEHGAQRELAKLLKEQLDAEKKPYKQASIERELRHLAKATKADKSG